MIWANINEIPPNVIENDLRAIDNMKNKVYLDEYNWD